MKPNTDPIDAMHQGTTARKRWMGILARSGSMQLEAAMSILGTSPEYEYLRSPEVGMTMVRGRAGGKGERFNLGEMTMTRCSVKTQNGTVGHGYVAGRDKKHAELAAVFDALLQSPTQGPFIMESVIKPLQRTQEENRREQAAKTAATRVNFFTMVRGEHK